MLTIAAAMPPRDFPLFPLTLAVSQHLNDTSKMPTREAFHDEFEDVIGQESPHEQNTLHMPPPTTRFQYDLMPKRDGCRHWRDVS